MTLNNPRARRRLAWLVLASLHALATTVADSSVLASAPSASSSTAGSVQSTIRKRRRRGESREPGPASPPISSSSDPVADVASPRVSDGDRRSTLLTKSNRSPANTSTFVSPPSVGAVSDGARARKKRKRKRRREDAPWEGDNDAVHDDNDGMSQTISRLQENERLAALDSEGRSVPVSCSAQNSETTAGDSVRHRKKKRRRKTDASVGKSDGDVDLRRIGDVILPIDGNFPTDAPCNCFNIQKEETEQQEAKEAIETEGPSFREPMPMGIEMPTKLDGLSSSERLDAESPLKCSGGEYSPPSLTVLRNETTEKTTVHDETDPDAPVTYEYTKCNEDETIEGDVSAEIPNGVDVSSPPHGTTPAATAFVRSSRQHENIRVWNEEGGSALGRATVTVEVSQSKTEQTVHIKRTTRKVNARVKSTRSPAARGGGKDKECLRRIRREWRDAVDMGIAYDWIEARTIGDGRDSGNNKNDYVRIGPFGRNLLRWHFSVSGPPDSPYEDGIYHGRVLLPRDYPGSPPRVQVLTPSGRFVCGADICLSASSHHPETWTPRWTVLSLVDALRLHMLTTANEIGGVTASDERRRECAEESRTWSCSGVADHGRMVRKGIFPSRRAPQFHPGEEGAGEAEGGTSVPETSTSMCSDVNAHSAGDVEEGHPSHVRPLDLPSADPEHAFTQRRDKELVIDSVRRKTARSTKSGKHRKARRSQEAVKVGNGASRATGSRGGGPKATSATPRERSGSILSVLLRRITVEALRIPLRILSILLVALGGLESLLRTILDNL